MTSLITGADGFVGRALCARLGSEGETVRRAVRSNVGDIAEVTDWSSVVKGVDVVYHLAARVHVMREIDSDATSAYRRTNVDATVALARAAARAGVKHFVFVSSVKAAAETSGAHPLRESDEPRPEDDYGRSKLEAERQLDLLRTESPMHVSIVRPPLVYGPGVRANFYRLLQAVDRFVPLPLARVRNRRSLVYVENLVDALVACAHGGADASRTFYVSDGEDVSTPDLARRIAVAMHRRALLVPVPIRVLEVAAGALNRRGSIERLTASLAVDSSAIRTSLGWRPPFTLDEGLKETVAWYKQAG